MKTADIIIRAGRNLRESKARTILTALAIAVGATTITLALAAGAAGRSFISEQAKQRGLGDYAVINVSTHVEEESEPKDVQEYQDTSTSGNNSSAGTKTSENESSYMLHNNDLEKISKLSGVKEVLPRYLIEGKYIQLQNQVKKFEAPYVSTINMPLNQKDLSSGDKIKPEKGEAIITDDFAKAFGVTSDNLVGKSIAITMDDSTGTSKQFNLVVASTLSSDYVEKSLFVSQDDAKTMYEYQSGVDAGVYNYIVTPDEVSKIEEVVGSINQAGYSAYSSEYGKESAMEAINVAQWALVGFGAIALLAAIFGIINTQYISVLERTQQIGLMKAVGMSRKDVARLFRNEAAWVGLLGGLTGVGVAYLVSLASPFIKQVIGLGNSDIVLFMFEPLSILIILASLVLIAVASGYFPSRKAAKLDPIEALRSE